MAKSHVKELFSHTAIYGAGIMLNKFLSFLLIPVYTFYFSPSDLGLYNLIQSLWLFIILIYVYGMETSFIKFFIDAKDEKKKTEIYSTSLILITLTSIIFSGILYIFAGNISSSIGFENIEKGKYLIKILSILLFFDTISRFPLLLLRAELKAKTYLFLSVSTLMINLSLNIFFIMFIKLNVEAILYSYIISVIYTLAAGMIITKKFFSLKFSFQEAKALVVYGNKFIYFGLFLLLIDVSDRFFLKYYFDESVVGIYSASYRLGTVMSLAIAAFRFSWTPYFLNIADNPDNKRIIPEIFTYFVFAGLILFLFFAFFTEPIVKFSIGGYSLLDSKYYGGLVIIPIILLSYFFSGLFANMNVVPFYANKTSILLLISSEGLLLNVILNVILIPKYMMLGAAYSTLITYAVMFIHIYFLSQKIYKIKYQWREILILSAFSLILFSAYYYVQNYTGIRISLKVAIYIFLLTVFLAISNLFKIIKISSIKLLIKRGS
ncbi:MAG: oligosaccharide flippase family protein [Ignavibacteriae bacterium]|nr:oligosaccharide flippase family protein [Ignavibacteriota bacterium]